MYQLRFAGHQIIRSCCLTRLPFHRIHPAVIQVCISFKSNDLNGGIPMKKQTLLSLAIFLLLAVTAMPQKRFEGGLTIGTGFADFRGLDAEYFRLDIQSILSESAGEDFPVEPYSRNFTLTGGGFVTYNVLPWLGLRGGVEYVPKGMVYGGELYLSTNLQMESEILKYSMVYKLTYLEFPVSLQLSTRSKKKIRDLYFYVNMGVAPAMNLSSKLDITMSLVEQGFNNSGVTEDVIDSDTSSEDLEGFNSSDLGVLVSAGVVFNSIGIDIKLTNGRKSIIEDSEESDFRNNNISVAMWFIF